MEQSFQTKNPLEFKVESPEARLEQGVIFCHPWGPFELSQGELELLRTQELTGMFHKNISYSYETGAVTGSSDPRLKSILGKMEPMWFTFLADLFPDYVPGMSSRRLVLNNTESATRKIRLESRDDLLHFDIPQNEDGSRVLKCYWNLDQNAGRVWAVGPTVMDLMKGGGFLKVLDSNGRGRTGEQPPWKQLHHSMKRDVSLQNKLAKTIWRFPPNAHWVALTDGLIHGTLRGASVLEFHVTVQSSVLKKPECHPVALWRKNSVSTGISYAA